MRTFIQFIRRFFNLILFLGLEIVCIVLIARTKTLQGNDIMNSANAVNGYFYHKQNDLVYYFGLRQMNDSLQNENMRLRAELAAIHSRDTLKDHIGGLADSVNDSTHIIRYAQYQFRAARVISNSVIAADNYITINRGSADGIEKNMAVVSGNGLVGKVEHVSAHYAVVLSLLSVKQKVSAGLKDVRSSFISWEGDKPDILMMEGIQQEIKVKIGDSVHTTGFSQYLPAGILIGTVVKKETLKKDNSQRLYVRPATNFRNLQYVYVIGDKMLGERIELEDSVKRKK
ncbi:rod shape-determining protein MreC [Chitinophagaceae bacterium MMS25-I14]